MRIKAKLNRIIINLEIFVLQQKAIKIKKVLDGKGILIDMNALPDEANFKDSLSKKNIYYLSNQERLIYLEKIGDSWFYSRTTIANINELHAQVYPAWAVFIDNFFTSNFSNTKYLGIQQWQWISFLFIIGAAFLIYFLAKLIGLLIFRNVFKRFFKTLPDEKIIKKFPKNCRKVVQLFSRFKKESKRGLLTADLNVLTKDRLHHSLFKQLARGKSIETRCRSHRAQCGR